MPVPLPDPDTTDLTPPDRAQVELMAAGVIDVIFFSCDAVNSLRKWSISRSISSRRSRRGGSLMLTTLRRW